MPPVLSEEVMSSFYADDTSYAASVNTHKRRKLLYQHISKKIMTDLESFCSKWRIKLNAEKTWCLNFHINKENDSFPRLWLKGELLRYTKSFKFLGITFDPKLTYEKYTLDIAMHSKKS